MKVTQFANEMSEVPKAVDFLRAELTERKLSQKNIMRTLLAAEDVITKMVQNSTEPISISVGGLLGSVEIHLSAKGTPFESSEIEDGLLFAADDAETEETNDVIRNMIEKVYEGSIVVRNVHGVNKVVIKSIKSHIRHLMLTLFAVASGLFVGWLMHEFLSPSAAKMISAHLFTPVYVMFMNALKMIVAPLVCCSIASSIADFGDLKALGKIAGKVVICYLLTSIIATAVGYLVYNVFPIGDTSLVAAVTDAGKETVAKSAATKISVQDTLIGIIPDNIITPFQTSNMLQLIFIAVVLGLAGAALVKKIPQIKDGLIILNRLCSKITSALVSLIPIIVFCSMAKIMISLNLRSLGSVIRWVPVVYAGEFVMMGIYLLLLAVFGRLNPFKFVAKYYPAMVTAFTFASSNASLPSSIKQMDKLGVSKRVYSFSLPLGATINMDGSCVTMMISALFMAKIFSIPVTSSIVMTLFASIILLSVGAPGVPGAALICITLLLPQIGVPAEAVSLIMGLYPIVGMMMVCTNVTGDAVVTTIVARHEKLLDLKKYNE